MSRLTLVLGASTTAWRYSYLAANRLLDANEGIYLLGKTQGSVRGNEIHKAWPDQKIHTVTLYLNPTHQKPYYDLIVGSKPKRVIFNPGTENPELQEKLTAAAIPYESACTLVMLAINQY